MNCKGGQIARMTSASELTEADGGKFFLTSKSGNVAYLHDGSFEGLLSAVFLAFERHELPTDVVASEHYEPRLGQEPVMVETDIQHALRVRKALVGAAGDRTFRALLYASLNDDYDVGITALRFVAYVMAASPAQRRKGIMNNLSHPVVGRIEQLRLRASNEAEKMRQFIRFSHLENGIWFARCNPNVSVVPLVMGHFAARLNDQPFIIYDENHKLSGIYDCRSWQLVRGEAHESAAPTSHDAIMTEAWQAFYDSLCVDARYNPELRRNFMPKRLWKNLPEMKPAVVQAHSTEIKRPPV